MSYPSRGRGAYRGNGNGGYGDRDRGVGTGTYGDRERGNGESSNRDRGGSGNGGFRDRGYGNGSNENYGQREHGSRDYDRGSGGRGSGGGGYGSYRDRDRDDSGDSRRRPREDDRNEGPNPQRQRLDSYDGQGGDRSLNAPSDGGRRGRRMNLPKPPRAPRVRIPLEEWKKKMDDERKQDKEREKRSYDHVPTRPNEVTSKTVTDSKTGIPVPLQANFYKLRTMENRWTLQNYHVDFEPPEKLTFTKRDLLKPHAETLRGYVFNGSDLYTPHHIDESNLVLYSTKTEGETTTKTMITLKHVGTVEPFHVQYLHIYSLIIRSCFRALGLDELGRNFFDRGGARKLHNRGLEIWPGYTTAVRNYDGGIMLNLDFRHKVLRKENCLQIVNSLDQEAVHKELVGNIIITHYNRKTYKVNDIDWEKTPLSTFEYKGKEITFLEYYTTAYPSFPIRDMEQPLLVHNPKRKDRHRGQKGPVLLIPELCNLTGLSQSQREDFQLMREVHGVTSMDPATRAGKLRDFMKRLTQSTDVQETFAKWAMALDPKMQQVTGRLLKPEELTFGKDRSGELIRYEVPKNADWTIKLRDPMFSSVELKKWIIIVGNDRTQAVNTVIHEFGIVARGLNFRFNQNPEVVHVSDSRNSSAYVDAVDDGIARVKDCQLVFVILSSPNSEIYSAVKKRCTFDHGVLSQCFQAKHTQNQKGIKSIMTKVLIQMNAKLGGEPWITKNPFLKTNTMVVGFDVHHSGKGKKANSIGAMVATTNKNFSQFYSTVSRHFDESSLSLNICTDFTKCLHAFQRKNNGELPDRIFMYRDGVGQGDLKYVHNTELKQIQTSLDSIYGQKSVGFTFIIVTKKGNARIMRTERENFENPQAGTVVDSVITLPERYDFFLVSSEARRGQSVSPTAYNVLKVADLPPERLQILTHKFCHMYYNWSGTVAVPFVCQYAHKLSFLTGTVSRGESFAPAETLANHLYFL